MNCLHMLGLRPSDATSANNSMRNIRITSPSACALSRSDRSGSPNRPGQNPRTPIAFRSLCPTPKRSESPARWATQKVGYIPMPCELKQVPEQCVVMQIKASLQIQRYGWRAAWMIPPLHSTEKGGYWSHLFPTSFWCAYSSPIPPEHGTL